MTADAGGRFLPYGRQDIDADDLAAVSAALQSDYLTTGPTVGLFETEFAAAVGARYAVASNSGTAALHLACMALDLGPGESVVVPAVTFMATANAARFCGAEVIFADVDPDSGLLTAETFQAAIDAHPRAAIRAVLPVHLNGYSVDMPAIRAIAEPRGIAVIEDACHALGGEQAAGNHSRAPVGACALSDMACFSLHPVKTVTSGEGGVTTTNDERAHRRMSRFRTHGITREPAEFVYPDQAFDAGGAPNPWYHEMAELGFNFRITDFACALGRSQMKRLPDFARRRRALMARYGELLAPLAPHVRPVPAGAGGHAVLHLCAVLIDFPAIGRSRAQAMQALKADGIGTQVHYIPVNRQPYYRRRYGAQRLPGADAYYERVLSIPLFTTMRDQDVDRVVDALRRLIP
ncbi:MAG TPA: UDP-4-amino-4,6-dideoxy-N-acetyl-beta-L-altrosamine transaminase [Dongiaceae bacterium]|nr:UDP-4-amino-4,6-dideoxy-N-acetyl-beta-L-altrosamine transaminase [Dongiaceae bacterium]